ncbi:hypothetical protein BC834DRAFT_702091 [Gloeopeniophorella convolvens]|nr:hypothetical protein BC834DRAFT_702091 [Gloeopeniophorella convolvens]
MYLSLVLVPAPHAEASPACPRRSSTRAAAVPGHPPLAARNVHDRQRGPHTIAYRHAAADGHGSAKQRQHAVRACTHAPFGSLKHVLRLARRELRQW